MTVNHCVNHLNSHLRIGPTVIMNHNHFFKSVYSPTVEECILPGHSFGMKGSK